MKRYPPLQRLERPWEPLSSRILIETTYLRKTGEKKRLQNPEAFKHFHHISITFPAICMDLHGSFWEPETFRFWIPKSRIIKRCLAWLPWNIHHDSVFFGHVFPSREFGFPICMRFFLGGFGSWHCWSDWCLCAGFQRCFRPHGGGLRHALGRDDHAYSIWEELPQTQKYWWTRQDTWQYFSNDCAFQWIQSEVRISKGLLKPTSMKDVNNVIEQMYLNDARYHLDAMHASAHCGYTNPIESSSILLAFNQIQK